MGNKKWDIIFHVEGYKYRNWHCVINIFKAIGDMECRIPYSTQFALVWALLSFMVIQTGCHDTTGEQSYNRGTQCFDHTFYDGEYLTMKKEDSAVRQYICNFNRQSNQVYIKPGETVHLVFRQTFEHDEHKCNDILLFVWSKSDLMETVRSFYRIIYDYIQTNVGFEPKFERKHKMIVAINEHFCMKLLVDMSIYTVSENSYRKTCSSHVVLFSTAYVYLCNATDDFIGKISMKWKYQTEEPPLLITYSSWLSFTLPDTEHSRSLLADFYQCTYIPIICKSSQTYPYKIFVIVVKETVHISKLTLGLDNVTVSCIFVLPPSHNDMDSRINNISMNYSIAWSRNSVMIPANSTNYTIETLPPEKLSGMEFSLVRSVLTILDGDENDFGNYTCTIKCYITANGSKLDEINLCQQQRTRALQPEDYINQALHFKNQAIMYKNGFYSIQHWLEDSRNSCKTLFNVSMDRLKECKTFIDHLFIYKVIVIGAFMIAAIIVCIICFLCVYCKYRSDKATAEYIKNVKKVLLDISRVTTQTVPENLKYDIYLSHSKSDSIWVETLLLPFLEQLNYKVCFGDRDFLPGETKLDCVWQAINESWKTIVVLSPDFLNSRWCVGYELTLTLTKLVDANGPTDSLVILKCHSCDFPKILTGRNFLDFTDESTAQPTIEKLLEMLGRPIHRESD